MVRLRRFRWSDLDGLLAVYNAIAAANAGQSTRETLQSPWRWSSLRAERDLWVAEDRGQIVAYGGLRPWHSAGWLQAEVAVHPGWRRRGLGRGLLARLLEVAQARGALHLCAVAPDEPGEEGSFLLQHGFQPFVPRLHMRLQPIVSPVAPPVAGYGLRLASDDDCAALAEVNNAAYDAGERVGRANAAGYRRFIDESGARVWVAEERASGLIAGLCEVRQVEAALSLPASTGHIGSLAVLPTARRLGLGRWLLARGIDFCQQAGWPSVELNVDRDNAPALRLYEGAGFRPVYAFTVYRRSLLPAAGAQP